MVNFPVLHDLSFWKESEGKIWEIGVPSKHSFEWSIIFSYLFLTDFETIRFEQWLGNIVEKDEVQHFLSKGLLECFQNFNPCLEPQKIFSEHQMQSLLKRFLEKIQSFESDSGESTINLQKLSKLQTVSRMLKCRIAVYFYGEEKVHYIQSRENDAANASIMLKLFHRGNPENIEVESDLFAFAVENKKANAMRSIALNYILGSTQLASQSDLKNIIPEILDAENIIIYFLSNNRMSLVYEVYTSKHIAQKLARAGFETDAKNIRDSNMLSVLYHATKSRIPEIPRIIYDYAVSSHATDKCLRDPDNDVILNLEKLGEIIKKDISYISRDNTSDVNEKNDIISQLELLSRFNAYQVALSTKIKSAMKMKEDLKDISIKSRRDLVSSILEQYIELFYYKSPTENDVCSTLSENPYVEKFLKLQNFKEFYNHYEDLDCLTYCFLLDNFYLLLRYLNVNENSFKAFDEILSRIILFLASKALFSKKSLDDTAFFSNDRREYFANHLNELNSLKQDTEVLIPFFFRESLEESMRSFQQSLAFCDIKCNKKECETDNLIRKFLDNFPEMKDELVRYRLSSFVHNAIDIDQSECGAMLAIERFLQVIGESVARASTSMCLFTFLLNACLHKEVKDTLVDIRNKLSHSRKDYLLARKAAENKLRNVTYLEDAFKKIIDEIERIFKAFEPAEIFQTNRVGLFLVGNTLQEAENLLENIKGEDAYSAEREKLKLNLDGLLYRGVVKRGIICVDNDNKFLAYNLLLDFISSLPEDCESGNLVMDDIVKHYKTLKKFFREVLNQYYHGNDEPFEEIESIYNFLQSHESLSSPVLKQVKEKLASFEVTIEKEFFNTKSFGEKKVRIQCPCLMSFRELINSFKYFNDDEKQSILTPLVQCASRARKKLECCLTNNELLSENEKFKLFKEIKLSSRDMKDFMDAFETDREGALRVLENADVPESKVEKILEKLELSEIDYEIISKHPISEELRSKFSDLLTIEVDILLDRIVKLKRILIEEDANTNRVWVDGRHDMMEEVVYLAVQRYQDPRAEKMRASSEMAFFDCVNILYKRKDLKDLWTKANFLVTGLNLRKLLAHGYRAFQAAGASLDPDDLPRSLIRKMLELVEDREAVENMLELCRKFKFGNTEEMATFINDENNATFPDIRNILKSKRWEKFLHIMPLNLYLFHYGGEH